MKNKQSKIVRILHLAKTAKIQINVKALVLLFAASMSGLGAHAGIHYERLKSFGLPDLGESPSAPLIQASDGALYGTTSEGGTNYAGTIFKLNKDGSGYTALHSFGSGPDGLYPTTALVEGSDGALYGTTWRGGTNGAGIIFKLNKDGTAYSILLNLDWGGTSANGPVRNGETTPPQPRLMEASDGALYGTTSEGGTNYAGTIFKLNKDGSGYTVLYTFGNNGLGGLNPNTGLVRGSDGAFYGTTGGGGTNHAGTVFKLNADGNAFTILHCFGSPVLRGGDGQFPTGLIQANDGALYGTTGGGGSNGGGTVFKLNEDGSSYDILRSFGNTITDGRSPMGLVQGSDRALYGTTYDGGGKNLGTVFRLSADGSGYSVLHDFSGPPNDGQAPAVGVIEGTDGMLYGETWIGGSNTVGTVFKMNKDGSGYRILHSFSGTNGDGFYPSARLLQGNNQALYGTTYWGGINDGGIVFKLNTDGSSYSVLYNFGSTGVDGSYPLAAVVQGSDGALYGTTSGGGAYTNQYGTVFRVNPDGTGYTMLYSFRNADGDGQNPQAELVQGSDGVLYGTTFAGGDSDFGTVFKIWPPETPDMLRITALVSTTQVTFTGMSSYQYQVLRSTDFTNWSVLTTITMPSSGICTNIDNTPPASGAYYRAAWIP